MHSCSIWYYYRPMTFKDPNRPKGEGHELGAIAISGAFEQPLQSLLLPRPPQPNPAPQWRVVGEVSIREQLKELEAFTREFEVFSSRFMHHCDIGRQVSFVLRRTASLLGFWEPVSPKLKITILVYYPVNPSYKLCSGT